MKVLKEGHKYELESLDGGEPQTIQFIEKEATVPERGSLTPRFITVNDGTTNEEMIEVLIHRMIYLQNKFSCKENAMTITKLEEALLWQNKRTADRIKRQVEGKPEK